LRQVPQKINPIQIVISKKHQHDPQDSEHIARFLPTSAMIFVGSQKRENPKFEARNSKKIQMTKILNPKQKN
jgi:hypothetical protein